jgi:molybdopterin converting factor small subunit
MQKAELIIAALQERMGQIVANYETQIAILRAELTELTNLNKEANEYSEKLDQKLQEVDNG